MPLEELGMILALNDRTPSERAMVPQADWAADGEDGLLLAVDVEPSETLAQAPLIGVEFPAFNDGRALSLAVLLRTRFGFTGELRAVGDVRPDLLHYLVRCGFDSVELKSNDVTASGALVSTGFNVLAPYRDNYQASVVESEPAYRRVRRGA